MYTNVIGSSINLTMANNSILLVKKHDKITNNNTIVNK